MTQYYFSVGTAAWTFPLIAFLFALPYAVYNYRKYGSVSAWRTVILFSFAFYLQCAYFLVILPLPDPAIVAALKTPRYDLIPFHFIQTLIAKSPFVLTQPGTWLAALKSFSFLEPFFNFMLLAPLGIYLAYYFKDKWKKVLLYSFLLSLFFEISQLTGLFWLYPRPYRLFSIDDLMLNSLGGLFGYFLYSKLLRFLPKRERIDAKSARRSAHVGYIRRFIALMADNMVVSVISIALSVFFTFDSIYASVIEMGVYSIVVSILTRGKTLGRMLVRIKISPSAHGWSFALAMTIRYLCRSAVFIILQLLNEMIRISEDSQIIWLAMLFAVLLFTLADAVYGLRKGKLLWYERLSGTGNISTFKRNPKKRATEK